MHELDIHFFFESCFFHFILFFSLKMTLKARKPGIIFHIIEQILILRTPNRWESDMPLFKWHPKITEESEEYFRMFILNIFCIF